MLTDDSLKEKEKGLRASAPAQEGLRLQTELDLACDLR